GLSLMPPLLSDFDHPRGNPYSSHVGGEVVYDCSPSANDCPGTNRSSLHDIRPHADITAFPNADIAGQMHARINVTVSSNSCAMANGYRCIEDTITVNQNASTNYDLGEHCNATAQRGCRGHVR